MKYVRYFRIISIYLLIGENETENCEIFLIFPHNSEMSHNEAENCELCVIFQKYMQDTCELSSAIFLSESEICNKDGDI